MKIRGKIWKEGKHWAVSCPALLADTQGKTKKDALFMIEDWIKTMLDDHDFEMSSKFVGQDDFVISVRDPLPMIGLMLKRARAVSKFSLEEAKNRLGARSRNTYWQYEMGAHEPTIGTLEKLFEAMDFEMEINLVKRGA